jgi:FtsP/CotA-like multicopper oxidase with cupredoxin domain
MIKHLALLTALAACGDNTTTPPEPGDEPPRPNRYGIVTLDDINPDPDIVEVNLVARHEHEWDTGLGTMHGVAYNGVNPGPLLEAKLGDRIIVHVRNDLLWDTTIHWHGLRVPEAMDGVVRSNAPIHPGETFTYEFDARDAGLYWYHPHHHEAAQIELGLYGPILIHAPGEPALALDQPFLIDDVLLDENGEIAGYDPHQEGDPHDTHDPDGDGQPEDRFGNTLLVNGRRDVVLPVRAGEWSLLRIVNTASARFMRVKLEGHTFQVVGVDGGYLAEPYETDSLRIGIGERYQVLVHMTGEPGQRYAFTNTREPEDPFAMDPLPRGPIEIAHIQYDATPAVADATPTFPLADVPRFAATGRVDFTWELGTIIVDGQPRNSINGAIFPDVPTPEFPANGDYTFVVTSADSGSHPWHLHGNRFQIVDIDGVPGPTGWKDSADIRPGSRVTLRTTLDNPGRWMVHCHILRHIEEGMMGELVVAP